MDARDRGKLMHKLCDLIEEEFDELAAQAAATLDQEVRKGLYAQLVSRQLASVYTEAAQ